MAIDRLVLTPGEPAGIGPDLCIKIAQQGHANELVVVADPELMRERAELLKLPLSLEQFDPHSPAQATPARCLKILPVSLAGEVKVGELNPANAAYVLRTLTEATQGCLNGQFSALITAPVHKGVINDAGIAFSGHTEFLEQLTQTSKVVMMLATQGLRVALATTHLPLKDVANAITAELLKEVIQVLNQDLERSFGIKNPAIMVTGLNPHAGENGHLGREEIDTIIPTLNQLKSQGLNLSGPLPADTLFTDKYLQQADAVLAMYHDQGLPVLKYKGFGNAANITLGLPIIRTSVDHGTALDLAGTGKADCGSLVTAINYAGEMAHFRNQNNTYD